MPRTPLHRNLSTWAVSSVYGKIELLLLAYPSSMTEVTPSYVMERYGQIFRAFGDRVTFVVLGHFGDLKLVVDQAKHSFEQAMLRCSIDPQHQLLFCHTPLVGDGAETELARHSEFVQDPFIPLCSEDNTVVLLEPLQQYKAGNSRLAAQLSAGAGMLMQSTQLQIEGGNILIGDDYALVGSNLLLRNLPLAQIMAPEAPQAWIEATLKRMLGLRFIRWMGVPQNLDLGAFHNTGPEQRQPFFHIDLMAQLAGRSNTGKEMLLLAQIKTAYVHGMRPEDEEAIDQINDALERIEEQLESQQAESPGPQFEVWRMQIGGRIIGEGNSRCFVPYSYLNCQLECFKGVRRAYLPHFPGMDSLQAAAEEMLQRLGFRHVRFIANAFDYYAMNTGSLHCITKVLARSPE